MEVGARMSLVLPPYLLKDTIPKDSLWSLLSTLGNDGESLSRTYVGPDAKGRECTVAISAFHMPKGSAFAEGAVNEVVNMFSGMGTTDVVTTKRKVDLPIGSAWRGVATMKIGAEALSLIVYAGEAQGLYYQVTFTEVGAGEVELVDDAAIMDSLRFE
jgi:hypothetical protein